MEIKVKSKYLRISPRKIRPVLKLVRGQNAIKSREMLKFQPTKGATLIYNLLHSALATAKNYDLVEDKLKITEIGCDDGPRLKRGQPVSKGAMMPIQKRQCHLWLVISDLETNKEEIKTKE